MTKNNIFLFLFAFFFSHATAQTEEGYYRYDDATQLWRLTQNAAALSLDMTRSRGYAEFNLRHRDGDFHRVQEGGQQNQLTFNTERYQTIGKYLVGYGRFAFDMDRTKERAWADVMRPYNANPFFSGSSIKGKYDTQLFDLTAALGTVSLNGWRLGARLDYKVGDLSRLRDPRSRNELLQYRITPAVTYTKRPSWREEHTMGLSFHYDRRKEKLASLTTVQEDPNLMYYLMSGMEQANGTVGGFKGFSREWVNHELGAELIYNIRTNKRFNSLTTVSIARGTEDAWGQYKYTPGKYTSFIYSAATRNRLRTEGMLHQLDVEASLTEGYADEYRQTLIQERDADNGYTNYRYETQLEYKKRYQVKTYDAALHYRCSMVDGTTVYAYLGLGASLQGTTNKHLLKTSQLEYQRMNLLLEAGYALMNGRLWLDATATYSPSTKADLQLADATTDYAQQVLQPDLSYYNANYRRGQFSAKYIFPLKIKSKWTSAYIKAYYDRLKSSDDRCSQTVGLSFGIFN